MLRSLVGSEMCIRDSSYIALIIGFILSQLGMHFSSRFGRSPRFDELFKGCLLYTSDAADDLLCVDLGGRRIIKKKNNNKHDWQQILQPP